jgi:Ser/Thr protein kinase RdoA (MazF antagonist)
MIRIPKPSSLLGSFSARARRCKGALSLAEIEAVLTHYDLGQWQIDQLLAGGNSDNVSLQTSRGKKVLKRYRWSLPSTLQEHSILRHLATRDFPLAQLEVNKAGLTYTELADKHYAVYDFIDGFAYSNYFMSANTRQRLVTQAGETLAWFHQAVVGFVPEGRKFNGFMPGGERLWRDVAWHLAILEQFVENTAKKKLLDEPETFLLSIADEIRHDLIEEGRYYEQPDPQLPKLVTHGDYSPKNVLFNQWRIAAVLDFGDACVNLRALDVARGLTSFARVGRCGVDHCLARTFLLAYQARQPLFNREVEAIPDLIRWRYLQNIISTLFHLGSQPSRQTLNSQLTGVQVKWEQAHWMKVHGDELRASLLAVI